MKNKIRKLLTEARKEQSGIKVSVYSSALAAIQESEVRQNKELSEDECLKIIEKEKTAELEIEELYREKNIGLSINAKDKAEILSKLLPEKIPEKEYENIAKSAIMDCNAWGVKDMGRVVKFLKENYGMRLDYKIISPMVKQYIVEASQ